MYFKSLQSLRGIFALFIYFSHYQYSPDTPMFTSGAYSGVTFFFILSGFVLSQGYSARIASGALPEPLGVFLVKRFSKIYPLHLLCLVACAVFMIAVQHLPVVPDVVPMAIPDIFLLQAWIPSLDWAFSLNGVSWCLSDFLFFYLLFPYLFRRLSASPRTFIRVWLAAMAVYIAVILPLVPDGYIFLLYINPLLRLLDFVFGMLLWHWLRAHPAPVFSRRAPLHLLWITLLLTGSIMLNGVIPDQLSRALLWWPACAVLIAFAVRGGDRLLGIRPLVWFGNISFSFYLLHCLVFYGISAVTSILGINMSGMPRLILVLAVEIAIAAAVNRYFVVPVERAIRKKIAGRA